MNRTKSANRIAKILLVSASGATVFQLLPSCETLLTTINPCGSVFGFCSPYDIEELFVTIPDYSYDPTCTIPGFGYDPENAALANGCASQPVYPTSNGNRP